MKKILTALLLLCLQSMVGIAQMNVMRINENTTPPTNDGVFYSLPRTVVRIDVSIDRVEHYKGPYAEFALKFLGLKNVIQSNSIEYRISDIVITTYPEPDPDQYYFVEFGEKGNKAESGLLALSDAGLILGTLPSSGDSLFLYQYPATPGKQKSETGTDAFGELFKYSADISVFEKVDTIIRKINIDTMSVERQYLKRTIVEKSPEQKAREAADYISKIKENRFGLLSGTQEVNYNRETLEYMDTQLKSMEKEYLKLFTGISLTQRQSFSYKYIPVANQINTEIPVFKFLKNKGIIDLDEQGGKVITIKVQRVGNTNTVASYLRKSEKDTKTQGFSYRIPELARVTVKLDENTQEETQCLINQLGVVTYLPSNKWKVSFHPQTGGIRQLEIR